MTEHSDALRRELKVELTDRCVQCGYCLPACPTYATMGKETHSPRGRINLVKMVGEGRITDLSVLEEPFDLCLGCRACEPACPVGVQYGEILESARAAIEKRRKLSGPVKAVRRFAFRNVLPSRGAMNGIGNALWLYQKSGLQRAARKSGAMRLLPSRLAEFERILPKPVSPKQRSGMPGFVPAKGEKKYTVAFFAGCVMDAIFRDINELSVRLLAEAGCDVIVPERQTCCGALHAHSGDPEQGKALAKVNIETFLSEDVDIVVSNAGGCGAMLSEYGRLLADEPEWEDRARRFADMVKDISQVIALCGGIPYGERTERPPERVTYQRSCHMSNVQKVTREPLELILGVPNVKLVEMQEADMCCGSAGIYNLVHYDESMDILDRKMAHVKDTGAATIITTNPGCLLQMKLGIRREHLQDKMRAVHLVEFLAEAAGLTSRSDGVSK
jgi:glycolate oxidase iron-sulfur subunit